MNTHTVIKGDLTDTDVLSPFSKGDTDVNNVLSNGTWVCKSAVVKFLGDTPILLKTVTDKSTDDKGYNVYLDPSETATLPVGKYIWVSQITNSSSSPVYNKEYRVILKVTEQGIV